MALLPASAEQFKSKCYADFLAKLQKRQSAVLQFTEILFDNMMIQTERFYSYLYPNQRSAIRMKKINSNKSRKSSRTSVKVEVFDHHM